MSDDTLLLQPDGFSVQRDGNIVATFAWTTPGWTVYLEDFRVPSPYVPLAAGPSVPPPLGSPRITSFDRKSLDQDRDILNLPADPGADVALGTNPTLPGSLKLHWGPLHLHSMALSDSDGKLLITEAFNRGFEVRRSVLMTGKYDTGRALVTRIRPVDASSTPEVNKDHLSF